MSRKAPYVKLNLGQMKPGQRRSSVVGGTIIADYVNSGLQRIVVIECAANAAPKPPRKAKAKQPEGGTQ